MKAPEPKPRTATRRTNNTPMSPAEVERRRNYFGPNPGYSDSWEYNGAPRANAAASARLTAQSKPKKKK